MMTLFMEKNQVWGDETDMENIKYLMYNFYVKGSIQVSL